MLTKIRHYLSLVRFSHTLFALPFALASLVWASNGLPTLRIFLLVVLCMVTCRNAAMAFNRLVDAAYDAENPRTARRHIPAGILTRKGVLVFFLANAALFVAGAGLLNPLALALSLPALAAVCFYSLTKRFTAWSHLFLGLAIGISPVGAWIAARGAFGAEAVLLCLIAGFDIIYATQDEAFDRKAGLHSVVARYGRPAALRISLALHALMLCWLILIELAFGLGWPFRAAVGVTAALLAYLHLFRRSDSLDGLNQDFFLANIAISVIIFFGLAVSVLFFPTCPFPDGCSW
jgi:4-hydroxybenzoate polyprenyltransferase